MSNEHADSVPTVHVLVQVDLDGDQTVLAVFRDRAAAETIASRLCESSGSLDDGDYVVEDHPVFDHAPTPEIVYEMGGCVYQDGRVEGEYLVRHERYPWSLGTPPMVSGYQSITTPGRYQRIVVRAATKAQAKADYRYLKALYLARREIELVPYSGSDFS